MLVYNILSNLTSVQIVAIVGLGALFMLLGWLVFQIKPSLKVVIVSIIAAIILALLSSLIGYGFFGGMMYHERFGWPLTFFSVSRNIEAGSLAGVPFAFHFDWLKFISTGLFWGILPTVVLQNTNPNRRFRIFSALFVTVFVMITLGFSLHNTKTSSERIEPAIPEAVIPHPSNPDPNTVKLMRTVIEEKFPEFADFENQASFAGQSVKVVLKDGEYYFAYLTLGSGIPIIKATCFRVDWRTAYEIGVFPNPLDSYRSYSDLDPQTCKGIR